ncbi:tetratricopeptide repeat protein [Brachyspira catarrhinii]|uniref:Tetratricopeptide repeat protein n=1 Tax=Brachyspira catarrhinii TaxID=2528966 RepID=A0ABY2TPK5_9SPIR|nr:tetratricopeptide repeat protein [Brachyspira catarrhinii]TKZ33465.1 tetratricopeptide repeat protein [Brachyspira catarrhinii]
MRFKIFLFIVNLIMFTTIFAQNTITVNPDNRVVTNETINRTKGGPLESDFINTVDLANNTLFSIRLNATNFDRYIRITSYSTNLDFVRFTRDKTNSFLTFTTLTSGVAKLNFQVDNEENIIRRYIYTINVTNAVSNGSSTNTNAMLLDAEKDIIANNDNNISSIIADSSNQISITNNNVSTNSLNSPSANSQVRRNENPETLTLFNSAEELKNIKDYSNAVNNYSNVISQYPNSKYSVYSHFRIADIYNNNKDYTNAFNMYKKAYDLNNANNNQKAAALYSMGIVRKSENNNEEAINYFNEVINKYAKTPIYGNASYEIADSLKRIGKISDGINILEKSLNSSDKFNKRADALLLLAEIYERGNNNVRDFNKAYQIYNQYIEEYPSSPRTKYATERRDFLYRTVINLQ